MRTRRMRQLGVALEHLLHIALSLAVERLRKVGEGLLSETNARSERMRIVIFKDTTSRINGAVNILHQAQIGDIQRSNDIGSNSVWLVVFAPVNVGTTSNPGRHDNVAGLYTV